MMTAARMFDVLTQYPFPGAVVSLRSPDDGNPHERLVVSLPPDITMLYYATGWWVLSSRTVPAEMPRTDTPDAGECDRIHAEIRRVLVLAQEPAPSWAEIKADCVGPKVRKFHFYQNAEIGLKHR